ncbi:MAG TPA: DUF934 domain-containing protein [Burkholderiales bacterium]|nr:DUF934 domain-containing protein [Burkholderiales bacterium]
MAALIKARTVVSESASPPEAAILRLEPHDDPESVKDRLAGVRRIDVHFPKFGEGRGYSTGWLLRTRYGYRGELRAVGHITRDHLPYLERLGFDAFELRPGEDPHEALAAFEAVSVDYRK